MNTLPALKSLAALTALCCTCGLAQAAWVADFRAPQFTVYLDAQRVTRDVQSVRVPTLYDYGSLQTGGDGQKYYSVELTTEVDCKGERIRLSMLEFHAGRMGGGEVVRADKGESAWEAVGPENKASGMWKLACGR